MFGTPVAVIVMMPVCVPTVSDPMVGLMVTVPLPVPEAGESVSQVTLSLAVQLRVPPPVFLMLSVWAAGLPPPCWAVNDMLVVLAPMAGGAGAAVTVKVTGTEALDAPVALIVMMPVWVPTVSDPVGRMVTVPLPVPEAGLRVNHAAFVVAFQFNVPPPLLMMVRICAGGAALPC